SEGHPIYTLQDSDVTDDLGKYRIGNLSQGVYYVTGTPKTGMARSAPKDPIRRESQVHTDKVRTFYPASPFIDAAVPVSLTPGEQRDGVDITLIEMPTYCVQGVATSQAIMQKTFTQVVSTAPGWWGGYGRSETKLGEQFE